MKTILRSGQSMNLSFSFNFFFFIALLFFICRRFLAVSCVSPDDASSSCSWSEPSAISSNREGTFWNSLPWNLIINRFNRSTHDSFTSHVNSTRSWLLFWLEFFGACVSKRYGKKPVDRFEWNFGVYNRKSKYSRWKENKILGFSLV